MIRLAVLLTAASLGLVSIACNGCGSSNPPPPPMVPGAPGAPGGSSSSGGIPATGETIIHVEDDGKSFDVGRGSPVTFKLASNAGTGFQWVPVGVDPNLLAQQGDRTQELSSDTPGAPKLDVYHFVAGTPGTAVVEMDLKRAFGNQPPGRVIHVTINVH
jgi:predicted secreted protein